MKQNELRQCLQRLSLSERQLSKLIGQDCTVADSMGDRCIRALVLKEDIRTLVGKWRGEFPDLQFVAIRTPPYD